MASFFVVDVVCFGGGVGGCETIGRGVGIGRGSGCFPVLAGGRILRLGAMSWRHQGACCGQGGITCIIIAHRLSTIRSCDEIIVMEQGVIKSRGTHKELMENSEIYRNLVSAE